MTDGTLPPFIGIRIKSLSGELHRRALRTLDLFVTTAVEMGGRLPSGFAVTLPKIQDVEQVLVLGEAMAELEQGLGIDPKRRAEELQIGDFCRIANVIGR